LANEAADDDVNKEKLERVNRMAEIEDLQAPREPPIAPLCIKVKLFLFMMLDILNFFKVISFFLLIQDPRDYFESQQANALKTL
ncbi:hypothetical protein, partial [Mycobacterium tuberculosis]